MAARHLQHTRVITVIVAHVIDDRVVFIQRLQHTRVAPVIVPGELRSYIWVFRNKTIDEKSDIRLLNEIRQKLLAVVGNARRLWVQRTEVSEVHRQRSEIRNQKSEVGSQIYWSTFTLILVVGEPFS